MKVSQNVAGHTAGQPMPVLDRKDLREAVAGLAAGAVVIALLFYFKDSINAFLGETLSWWLFAIVVGLYLLTVPRVIEGWIFVREGERLKREQDAADKLEQAEWRREEQEGRAEWEAFTNWVKQNPVTAERLMCVVEDEQIEGPEYRAWIAERRGKEGPNVLTDLPRLFDWLKAQRDLKKVGLNAGLPPTKDE